MFIYLFLFCLIIINVYIIVSILILLIYSIYVLLQHFIDISSNYNIKLPLNSIVHQCMNIYPFSLSLIILILNNIIFVAFVTITHNLINHFLITSSRKYNPSCIDIKKIQYFPQFIIYSR